MRLSHCPKRSILVALGLFILLAGRQVLDPSSSLAGPYKDSAHGQNISRYDLADLGYGVGNCGHCHEQHASINGSEPDPLNGGPARYLGFDREENLCFGCHGYGGLGNASDKIQRDISKSHGHNPIPYVDKHTAHEDLGDIAEVGNKHVECTDCHNPHRVGSTIHTKGTNAIDSSNPLYEASGVEPSFAASNWTEPISYGTLPHLANKEYQVCFKCHSKANASVTSWGGAGAEAFTDVALEFSPANMAGHPVVTGLNNYPNSLTVTRDAGPYKGLYNTTDGTIWDQLLDPWGVNAGNQTMYCSDCHASNGTPSMAGPHGSDVKWMLGGTNKAWPYTTYAKNGSSETESNPVTTEIFRRLKHLQSATLGDLGTDNGVFCANCHPVAQWTLSTNNVHSNGNHSNARCVDCHIRVPHGSAVSRLIAADNAATYTNLPARYRGNGAGLNASGENWPMVRKFKKDANWSYTASRCYSTATGIITNGRTCQFHDNASNGSEAWQSW